MDVAFDPHEVQNLRRVAFFAVAMSTVAVIGSAITLPLAYSFVQNLQSHMNDEFGFCKTQTRDMWLQVFSMQSSTADVIGFGRQRREWLFGKLIDAADGLTTAGPVASSGAEAEGGQKAGGCGKSDYAFKACTCSQGPPGPAGPPGELEIPETYI